MAYETKHFRSILDMGGQVGGNMWMLDTIDATASVDTAAYISDAKAKGVRKGDIVIVRIWTTAVPVADSELMAADGAGNDLVSVNLHFVIGINATTGAADLTATLALTPTNAD